VPPASAAGEEEAAAAGRAAPGAAEREDKGKAGDKGGRQRHPSLVRAYRAGRPVEGRISKVIKGGYEVKVGRARGFCPHSQLDLHREDDPESQVGKSYMFRITQVRRGGEDIVLSRRSVLEEGRAEEAKAVRATLVEGALTLGRVAGTAPFGAFVDLGAGVLGLVHISELAHRRVTDVAGAVEVGDTVRVKILKLDEGSGRISLSIRQAERDPWTAVTKKFRAGEVHPGKITRIADFGAFVELVPGVEALAPASEFPPSAEGWNHGLAVGESRAWYVLSVEPKKRRASVTPTGGATLPLPPLEEKSEHEGRVQRVEKYGVFVWLGPGRVGLMPRAYSGAGEGTDLRRRFPLGSPVEVSVVEISEEGRRIRLARKGVRVQPGEGQDDVPDRPRREEKPPAQEPPAVFGTSLAEKLKAALNRRDGS
jgi:small subunit ribosomal protein S1